MGVAPYTTPGPSPFFGTAVIVLSSAQLLALHSAPVTVIPAPGVGKYIQVISASYELIFGTLQYTSSDSGPALYYAPLSGNHPADGAAAASAFAGAASGVLVTGGAAALGLAVATSVVANAAVVLGNESTNMSAGNGTGTLTVIYAIVSL